MESYIQSNPKSAPDSISGRACVSKAGSIISKNLHFQKSTKNNKKFSSHLVYLANCSQSVHSSSNQLQNIRSESTVRYHLQKCDIEELCEKSEELLRQSCCNILKPGKAYTFAIDETDDPYYGKDKKTNEYVVGGKLKKSTTIFYRYISIAIVTGMEKFTLGILPVPKKADKVDLISKLIDIVSSNEIKIKMLMLDRGYYAGDIIDFLQKRTIPFIIPMKVHSNKTRNHLSSMKKSGKWVHSMKTSDGRMIEVNAGAVVKFANDSNTKRHKNSQDGKIRLPYIFGGCSWGIWKIHTEYAHRFGIETTFRMRNQAKPFTCSRNPAIRYLFALISMVLLNVWKAYQIYYFTKKGPGRKKIAEDLFRLQLFLHIVRNYLCRYLHAIDRIDPPIL